MLLEKSDTSRAMHALQKIVGGLASQQLGIQLWDGTCLPDEQARPATLVLKRADALRALFQDASELALAEAYLNDDFDIKGDIESVLPFQQALAERKSAWRGKAMAALMGFRLSKPTRGVPGLRGPARLTGASHSLPRDRQAIAYHYDVSNDFYKVWLDHNMVYSCGYFSTPDEDLDVAQERKLDYICRKLRLRRGQRFLDIGSGWGALVIHAARHYGADVLGITLSQPQAELANERIVRAGLAGQARVRVMDYREVTVSAGATYDAIASIGMCEHVGKSKLPEYFSRVEALLKPGGVLLNHGIADRINAKGENGPTFINTYVFPDGELVPVSKLLHTAEEAGLELRDTESLREHYYLTLRNWLKKLESHHEEALKYVDEKTYRVWRLFLAGSAYGFATGTLSIHQSIFVKASQQGQSGLPLTRSDWYAPQISTGVSS